MRAFKPLALFVVGIVCATAAEEDADFFGGGAKDPMFSNEQLEKMMEEGDDFDLGGGAPTPQQEQVEPLVVEYERKKFQLPDAPKQALLWTTFQDVNLPGWKKLADTAKFSGEFKVNPRDNAWVEGDTGMQLTSKSAFHGIARQLIRSFDATKEDALFASMEVQYEKPVGCGGAYFKLFRIPEGQDASAMSDQTPYSIMFGPDKCGHMTNKVHLIVKYPHPKKAGEYVEEHMSGAPRVPSGENSHQFGFEFHRDGNVKVYVDNKVELDGDMKALFKQPAFENVAEIDDKNDKKPVDWIDEKMIADPEAVKPAEWDESAPEEVPDLDAKKPEGWLDNEPLMVPNADATKPQDWIDAEDGEWKAPLIKNPACYIGCGKWERPMKRNPEYKGKWEPPMINNPAYKGEWAPRKIPNPDYYKYEKPYEALQVFNAVGFELWTVDAGAMIDNLIITSNADEYHKFIQQTWVTKNELETANIAKKEAAEKVAAEKAAAKAKAVREGTSSGGLFDLWKSFAQKNMTTLILSVTLPVATTLWAVSKLLRRRSATPVSAAVPPADDKKDDDAKETSKDETTEEAADTKDDGSAEDEGKASREEPSAPTSAGTTETIRKRKGSNAQK